MTLTCVSVTSGNASIWQGLEAANPRPRKGSAQDDEQRLVQREGTTRSIIGPARVWRRRFRRARRRRTADTAVQEERPLHTTFWPRSTPETTSATSVADSLDFHLARPKWPVIPRRTRSTCLRTVPATFPAAAGRRGTSERLGGDEHFALSFLSRLMTEPRTLNRGGGRIDENRKSLPR